MRVNCGFRTVQEILNILNEVFDGYFGKTPSHTTIEDWIQKCGLDLNKSACKEFSLKEYAIIIDESIMIGSQKLLLILGVPAQHPGHSLRQEDVRVLGMFVSPSWTSDEVRKKLELIMKTVGKNAEYIISDGGHNLIKSAADANIPRHRDISHTFGTILESRYKEDAEFKDFTERLGKARLQYHLTPLAYLLPPNQRSICRFMNFFSWVEWAKKMIYAYDKLNKDAQEAFKFVKERKDLILELDEVMSCYRKVETMIKNEGLSYRTTNECHREIKTSLLRSKYPRAIMIGVAMFDYFCQESKLLENALSIHNLSSDIIESTFGTFKNRKSPNKLCGITPFVLFIPMNASLASGEQRKMFDFKAHLENTRLPEVKKWREENLLTNWVSVRTKTLSFAV